MSLGDILRNVEDTLTGSVSQEPPQQVDPNADPAFDGEQGILSSAQDPYGDPADQNNGQNGP